MTAPTLRADQALLIRETDAAFRAGHRGVLCIAPTAFGKGVVIAAQLARFAAAGRRVLFVVHLAEIAFDVRARALAAGVPSVRVLSGDADEGDPDALITIATWQTLVARTVTLEVDLVVIDEAHRAKAATFLGVLARHPRARLLGYTATGQRGDGSGLKDVGFTIIVQGPQPSALVEGGHLAPITTYGPSEFVEALADDPAEVWATRCPSEPGVVFASSIPHSKDIATALLARGIPAMHVDSDTPAHQRAWAVEALESGELQVLSNFRLFVEGVNVPRAAVCMLASAFSHAGPYLQAIGRVRRAKARAWLYDLRGNWARHGLPDDDRVYSLEGPAIRTLEALPPVRQCPQCLCWARPTRVCAECGARLPPPKPPRMSKRQLEEIRRGRQDARPREGADWELWCRVVWAQRRKGGDEAAAKSGWIFRCKTGRVPFWRVDHVPAEVAGGEVASAAG